MNKKRPAGNSAGLPVGISRGGHGGSGGLQGDWREVVPVQQDAPGHVKTWLCHPRAELFVWKDAQGAVSAFQFCFEHNNREHMVAWDHNRPTTAGRVDGGESGPEANRSPIMVERPGDPTATLAVQVWRQVRDGLPPALVSHVEGALNWR